MSIGPLTSCDRGVALAREFGNCPDRYNHLAPGLKLRVDACRAAIIHTRAPVAQDRAEVS